MYSTSRTILRLEPFCSQKQGCQPWRVYIKTKEGKKNQKTQWNKGKQSSAWHHHCHENSFGHSALCSPPALPLTCTSHNTLLQEGDQAVKLQCTTIKEQIHFKIKNRWEDKTFGCEVWGVAEGSTGLFGTCSRIPIHPLVLETTQNCWEGVKFS